MAIIFNGLHGFENRGRVAVLYQDFDGVGGLQVGEPDGSLWPGFEIMKAIFTRIRMQENTNHQFAHMLGGNIYLYAFGDRIGSLSLTGLAFHDNCSGAAQIGISNVIQYYRANRLTIRPQPIKVTLDPFTTFECYLFAVHGDTLKVEERMYQFSMTLALIPPDLGN